jgi:type I restriction enzyme S subunit
MKPYPAYRDSGVEWIGEVPEHWKHTKIIYYSQLKTGGTPNRDTEEYWIDGTINWMSSGEINKKYVFDTEQKITISGLNNSNATMLPKDTVMIALNGQGKTKGMVAVLKTETTCNQSLAGFICDEQDLHYNYLFYYLQSKYKQMRGLVGDDSREGLSLGLLKSIYISLPPLKEQRIISNYLDSRIRKTDTLIEKKQKQIELLKEERNAIINQAVTKGLNLDVPMKDSGIEWLGEVPEHWEIKKLKYLATINPTKSSCEYTQDSGAYVTFLPMEKVSEEGNVDSEIKKPINELWNGFTFFRENDIIIAKITPCFENGKGAILKNMGSKIGFGSTEFHVIHPRTDVIDSTFLYYTTRTHLFKELGEASMTGAAGQKRVPSSFIENYYVSRPKAIDEQKIIVDYIESEYNKISSTIRNAEKQITLLQEYRTALISNAVTGKIDVRDEI